MKHIVKRIFCLLLCTFCLFSFCACPADTPGPGPSPDPDPDKPDPDPNEPIVYGNGTLAGTGDSLTEDAACLQEAVYDASAATDSPAPVFFRSDTWQNGGVNRLTGALSLPQKNDKIYDGKNTVVLVEAGFSVKSVSNVTLKNFVIVGDLLIEGASHITLENVQITGNVTVAGDAENVNFRSCRLVGDTALANSGTNTGVRDSYLSGKTVTVSDSGVGFILTNCRVTGEGNLIVTAGADAIVRQNSLKASGTSVGITAEKGALNLLVAQNAIEDMQTSVSIGEAYNTVVVRNSLVSVKAENNRHLYICDNGMGGRLEVSRNDYLLCDGNTYADDQKNHTAVQVENTNTNGDSLMNVDARAEAGADEALLPHTDKDWFLGMERKTTVRDLGTSLSAADYIINGAETGDMVILPPGAYVAAKIDLREKHSNTTIYAYGAYFEMQADTVYTGGNPVHTFEASNITLKGMSIGYATQSAGQVYVLEKLSNDRLRVITGAGMVNEFGNSGGNFSTTGVYLHRKSQGEEYVRVDTYISKVTKNKDGTMTVYMKDSPTGTYDMIQPGDVLTCRPKGGSSSVSTEYSDNIQFRDVTVFGWAGGFAYVENRNSSAITYYRCAIAPMAGTVIDEETFEMYSDIADKYGLRVEDLDVWVDENGNYRGSKNLISSLDAVNNNSSSVGSQVISCRFENMNDDGGNMHGMHARLSEIIDNGDGTMTVIYKSNLSEYRDGNPPQIGGYDSAFRVGDKIAIYCADGRLICDTVTLDATVQLDSYVSDYKGMTVRRYAVTVASDEVNLAPLADYDLSLDSSEGAKKVLVDNRSRTTDGFVYDNVLVANTRSRGILIKASEGQVINCTFRNCAKVGVAVIYELFWGEASYTNGLKIENNLFDNCGYSTVPETRYRHASITVEGLGGTELSYEYFLYQDIDIVGNVFVNRTIERHPWTVYLSSVKEVRILDNDFGMMEDEDSDNYSMAIHMENVLDIEISGNTYSPYTTPENAIEVGDVRQNIHGTDVTVDGEPLFPDS